MFVSPKSGPAAARKARWEAEQKARNEAAQAALIKSLTKKG